MKLSALECERFDNSYQKCSLTLRPMSLNGVEVLSKRRQESQLEKRARYKVWTIAQRVMTNKSGKMSAMPWFDRVLGLSRFQEELAAAEQIREQQAAKIQALEADLAQWKAESDTARQQHTARQQRVTGLEQRVTGLEQQLASKADALVEAQKENELILLQLHQVQEELEHYFLQSRAGDELAQAQQQQLRRAQALIARLLPKVATTDQSFELSPVEVLTPQPSRPQLSLQTEALLNSYAASLQRAAALLQRAMNR